MLVGLLGVLRVGCVQQPDGGWNHGQAERHVDSAGNGLDPAEHHHQHFQGQVESGPPGQHLVDVPQVPGNGRDDEGQGEQAEHHGGQQRSGVHRTDLDGEVVVEQPDDADHCSERDETDQTETEASED